MLSNIDTTPMRSSADLGVYLSNGLINRIIIVTVHSGALSSSIACVGLFTALAIPKTYVTYAVCFVLGRAYFNALLSSLNARSALRERLDESAAMGTRTIKNQLEAIGVYSGQPQQRPPNLTANPGIASQFRPTYPTYGIPPRTVLQANAGYVPNLQPNSHRTAAQQSQVQTLGPQPTNNFNQPRGQSSFAFGGALGQHQPSGVLQQQSLPSQQQHQQHQQQTNGAASSMASLLAPTSSLGNATQTPSTSEVGLDPNDFPALGPTTTSTNPSSSNSGTNGATATSYASQAGTGVLLGGSGGSGAIGSSTTNQARDFTPDDFPALGGQSHTPGQARDPTHAQLSTPDNLSHPPGLNGFQSSDQSQLRQNLIAGPPGMLNLGPTPARNVHPGFQQGQSDAEKQQQQQRNNFSLKLNQANHAAAAAWNSPNVNPSSQGQQPAGANGISDIYFFHFHLIASHTIGPFQNQTGHTTSGAISNTPAPTNGSPPFSLIGLVTGDSLANPSISNPNGSSNPIPTTTNTANPPGLPQPATSHLQHPQTPAQQVLISAADRWGLLSLLTIMRNANSDPDHGLTSIGTDLSTMGLDMGHSGNLYSSFITPWADQSAARSVEPEFHLPACYLSVQAPAPGPAKAIMFSDETLFFMFYSSPRDALQEVAAQELWNRNWRYHKELRLWITKESGTTPSQKVQGGLGEQGQYTYWDPDNWTKERKEMTVLYSDLEEKSIPAFGNHPNLSAAIAAAGQSQAVQSPQQPQLGGQPQPQLASRASFQMGIAGL
ncbi:hypothetical protein CVT24_007213 [Panaeolus cyanescens]|uniref:Uncharacterized protein n=1 Tax=Panaeolus cyanescens TaxID=181874 RepID=A0A409VJD3_9AGAR|nr:hypothetical protein CVT24_007213 [Panaeolus cyanescens]